MERFLAALWMALATAAIYLAARQSGRSLSASLALAALFSLAMPAFSTGSRAVWALAGASLVVIGYIRFNVIQY